MTEDTKSRMIDPEDILNPETGVIETAAAVVIVDDKVLLVEEGESSSHLTGMLGIPSGRVEPGESYKQAALRELMEESGLVAVIDGLEDFDGNFFQADIPRKDGTIKKFNWHVYQVNNFNGELSETADNVRPKWVELSQLNEIQSQGKLLPNVMNAIQNAQKAA